MWWSGDHFPICSSKVRVPTLCLNSQGDFWTTLYVCMYVYIYIYGAFLRWGILSRRHRFQVPKWWSNGLDQWIRHFGVPPWASIWFQICQQPYSSYLFFIISDELIYNPARKRLYRFHCRIWPSSPCDSTPCSWSVKWWRWSWFSSWPPHYFCTLDTIRDG